MNNTYKYIPVSQDLLDKAIRKLDLRKDFLKTYPLQLCTITKQNIFLWNYTKTWPPVVNAKCSQAFSIALVRDDLI